jgi:2-keto-3-deoxy-L-rhamnonate aldolase RhmA
VISVPSLKARFAAGERAVGCWLNLCSPIAAEIVAQAGYDAVLIDMEHGPGSYHDALRLLQAVAGHPAAPMARVPVNDAVPIKRTLDVGVSGIMIPAVDSVEEAHAAVAACRYAPRGNRGMAASIVRAADYGARWRDYVAEIDERLLIMCQIESAAAVEAAADIAAVDGVDLLFIGPFDLSAALGYLGQPDHPDVRARIGDVEAAAKAAGKRLGGIVTDERDAAALFAAGYDLVMSDADVGLLRDGAAANLAAARRSM